MITYKWYRCIILSIDKTLIIWELFLSLNSKLFEVHTIKGILKSKYSQSLLLVGEVEWPWACKNIQNIKITFKTKRNEINVQPKYVYTHCFITNIFLHQ